MAPVEPTLRPLASVEWIVLKVWLSEDAWKYSGYPSIRIRRPSRKAVLPELHQLRLTEESGRDGFVTAEFW